MASFDRTILPGGEGKIALKIRTMGYSGNHTWGARVYSNDPTSPMSSVLIKANVKSLIHVSSYRVYLRVMEGDATSGEIEIRGQLEKPLTLTPGPFRLEGKVHYRIEEVERERLYKVRFTNIPGPPETLQGYLQIATNYEERPTLNIQVILVVLKKT